MLLKREGLRDCPNTAKRGKTSTLQPGSVDIGKDPGNDPFYFVGTVADFIHLTPIGKNFVDAAISSTDLSHASSEIFGIGQPNPAEGDAIPGEIVVKSGRATAVTVGTVQFVNMTKTISTPACGAYTYVGTIVISSIAGRFLDSGDSGSAILDSATLTPVGLLFGGNLLGTSGLANPIKTVDQMLEIFPDGPSGTVPTSAEELSAVPNSLRETRDSRLARLEEIQARHEDELLSLPGVQGLGIGLDENGRDLAFYVDVTEETAELERALPKQIEGVPIRLVKMGEFKFF